MNREQNLEALKTDPHVDVLVIGGGATGIGCALEACLRGHRTLLVEKEDFTKGTSSKTTKLIHGGVRYLAQGDIKLVREALRERGYLRKNAAHLVKDQPFIMALYRWWELPFYTIGLKLYDLLAGRYSFGRSRLLSRRKVIEKLPGVVTRGLKGGVLYHDGQFDDSRLAMDLLHSLHENRGMAVSYCELTTINKDPEGQIHEAELIDRVGQKTLKVSAKCIINAAGVWVDQILEMEDPGHKATIRPSQGVHLTIDREFMPGSNALMIPKTSDGRVLFAVPWHGKLVVGTTDTPVNNLSNEPVATEEEIGFIISNASIYLEKPIERDDIRSVFTGLRPLAAPKEGSSKTKEISRSHKIYVSGGGLVTIVGGKWTTYRKMAEDALNRCEKETLLPPAASKTRSFMIDKPPAGDKSSPLSIYGSKADAIMKLMESDPLLKERIHPDLPYTWAETVWLAENEMVVHLEDLLARRTRALLLNAGACLEVAPAVAEKVAHILGWNEERITQEIKSFRELAGVYRAAASME
jgi:glycerol-3-phosphate dehydrogenase